jgi:uncharacterized membrane protein
MTDCSYVNNMIKEKYKLGDSIIPTIFSSIIASIGILTNSNTVVAGSMLLSPLLGPITYLINDTFKFKNIKRMSGTMTILVMISMFNGYVISKFFKNKQFELISTLPLISMTDELKTRTNKNLYLYSFIIAIICGVIYITTFSDGVESDKGFLGEEVFITAIGLCISVLPPLAASGIYIERAEYLNALSCYGLFFLNVLGFLLGAVLCKKYHCKN